MLLFSAPMTFEDFGAEKTEVDSDFYGTRKTWSGALGGARAAPDPLEFEDVETVIFAVSILHEEGTRPLRRPRGTVAPETALTASRSALPVPPSRPSSVRQSFSRSSLVKPTLPISAKRTKTSNTLATAASQLREGTTRAATEAGAQLRWRLRNMKSSVALAMGLAVCVCSVLLSRELALNFSDFAMQFPWAVATGTFVWFSLGLLGEYTWISPAAAAVGFVLLSSGNVQGLIILFAGLQVFTLRRESRALA